MRLPVGLLLIAGMIVFMYLFGLLVGYKYHQLMPVTTERTKSKDSLIHQDARQTNKTKEELDIIGRLRQKISCDSKVLQSRTYQRGSFWVMENYIAAQRNSVKCYESVTYTTHTDFTFLDNLVPIVDRWMAPVSVAIYGPGDDFQNTKESIFYMRNCLGNQRHMDLIRELVSFHLYFNASDMPTGDLKYDLNETDLERCSTNPMTRESYKERRKLIYPVNVGRNVARDAAATYFVFPSDIELYPSPKMVPRFLTMIAKEKGNQIQKHRVFPVAIYEVASDAKVPLNKTELVRMLKTKEAIRFHANICATCHSVPDNDRWESVRESSEMRIFKEVKRSGKFNHWEPIHIATQDDPHYDERLSWEGKSDKMTQGYLLCVLDYKFALLSDAFIVHRPGFKSVAEAARPVLEAENVQFIQDVIRLELEKVYGVRKGCSLQ